MNLDIAELDGRSVVVVLQAEVSADVAATFLAFEDVDEFVVENDGDLVASGDNFVGVPFADLHVGVNRGLDVVNGTRLQFMGLIAADLNLVTLFDGDPGVIARIREADEDAGVVGILGGVELDFEAGVFKFLFAIPPEKMPTLFFRMNI